MSSLCRGIGPRDGTVALEVGSVRFTDIAGRLLCIICALATATCRDSDSSAERQTRLVQHADLKSITETPKVANRVASETLVASRTTSRAALGSLLFFDKRLSADGSVACASCHQPQYAFSELTPVSTGIHGRKGRRKAPALINQAQRLYPHFFRDGRVASLEEQALVPIASVTEMGNTHENAVRTISQIKGYRERFAEAFGSSEVTKERVAIAIAEYVRTLRSENSAWDRWRRNHDESAVSEEVKRGHELFFGKAGCNQCHLGGNFTDDSFHNLGVGWNAKRGRFEDEGRYAVSR